MSNETLSEAAPDAGPPSGTPLTSPITFGRYRLLERIGAGGMAEIWRGVAVGDLGFERSVAIKRIREDVAQLADIGKLFADEARLSALLDHPNIVQVYDFGSVDGACYIAMEYLPGRNLDQVLRALRRAEQRLDPALAVFIAREVARGLAHAHALRDPRGRPYHIVHRDISPANIMLLRAGAVKLLDFGIARVTSELRLAVTQGGAVRGKCPYLAPEQISGGTIDARADIFALGVVLWEMLTGQRLFGGESDLDTIASVLNRRIPRPSTLAPEVPAALDDIVMTALERDIDRRYRLAEVMAVDLDEVMHRLPSRHGDLPALLARLFGPALEQRQPEQEEEELDPGPSPEPAPTLPRFALEIGAEGAAAAPLAGPADVTRPRLSLPALELPLDAAAATGDEIPTAVEVGRRRTTATARAVISPSGRRTFALVLATLLVTELAGALTYGTLIRSQGDPALTAAETRPAFSPVEPQCAPAAAPAPAFCLPRPSRRASAAKLAPGTRPAATRRTSRARKQPAVRPGRWAIGRKSGPRTIARHPPSARAAALHVDPYEE